MGAKRKRKLDYPVVECLEANIGPKEKIELVLGIVLMFFGFITPVFCFLRELFALGTSGIPSGLLEILAISLLFFGVFGIIGVVFFWSYLKTVLMLKTIKSKGKIKKAIVYEYTDDDYYIDGEPAQVVKLLIKKDKMFIYYQLGDTKQPYELKSVIYIEMYKNMFRIIED